jgi:CRISPR-associated protein Cmr3
LDLEEAFPIGVFLKKENEIYFPVPADILQPRKGEKGKLKVSPLISKEKLNKEFLKENSSEVFLTDREDLDILPFIKESETKYEGASGYISFEKIKKYLSEGNLSASTGDLKNLNYFIEEELKVGITVDFEKFTAMESRIYTSFINRPKGNSSLVVAVIFKEKKNTKFQEGIYYIGGETRVSKVQKIKIPELEKILTQSIEIKKGDLYKIYLLSHTYIEGALDIGKILDIGGTKFKLIWSFSRGKEWISGFRKPAIEMLQPATVLVIEALEDKIINKLNYISAKALLPIFEDKNTTRIKKKVLPLHYFGWNYGLLIPCKREV